MTPITITTSAIAVGVALVIPTLVGYSRRLVKSIRLHLDELLEAMRSGEVFPSLHSSMTTVKVLLLVRDPRGVLNSMLQSPFYRSAPSDWGPQTRGDPGRLCRHVHRDLGAVGALRSRGVDVLVLRYEDLVDDAGWQVRDLLGFLSRRELLDKVMQEAEGHVSPDDDDGNGGRGGGGGAPEFSKSGGPLRYYDTRRPVGFAHDAWREELPAAALERLLADPTCREVLDWMNYRRQEEDNGVR